MKLFSFALVGCWFISPLGSGGVAQADKAASRQVAAFQASGRKASSRKASRRKASAHAAYATTQDKAPRKNKSVDSGTTLRARETTRLYEALLARIAPRGTKCYVSLNGRDPGDDLIQSLRKNGVLIVGMSRSPHPFKAGRGSGLNTEFMLRLQPVRWMGARQAQVTWDSRAMSAVSTLENRGGQWIVTDQKTLRLS